MVALECSAMILGGRRKPENYQGLSPPQNPGPGVARFAPGMFGPSLARRSIALVSRGDQGYFVVFTVRGLHRILAVYNPAACGFPRLPHLRQESVSATAREHDSRPSGRAAAADHMGDDGTVPLTVHAAHYKYVDNIPPGD